MFSMPGGIEGEAEARRATMDARDLAHREELEEVKRVMRERKAACSSHAGSREERGPRRRHGASHGGARGDSRRLSLIHI